MKPKRISVNSSVGKYTILCGTGMLRHVSKELPRLGRFSSVHFVTSPRVWGAVGNRIHSDLGVRNFGRVHLVNDAEALKNLRTVESLSRELVRSGADRKSLIVAVGGGVIGDVCGFVAASYLRGVCLVHVPTTLVAQVDSAIGGKTGVNLPEGKNLVGAFYSPQCVLADPETLATLAAREYRSGLYEVIKYGVIGDLRLFSFLEKDIDRLLRREQAALDFVIPR